MDAYLALFQIAHHRSQSINGNALSPGQQCFTLMHGMGMSNRDMWDCLRTLHGRLPQGQAQLSHMLTQRRRFGNLVEQQERQQQPPRHFPTTADNNNNNNQNQHFDMSAGYPGQASSPLLCGGGGFAAAPVASGGDHQNVLENYAVDDDSDTSDDGSDTEDRHPDPHPADPDMTGWSANQVGW